MAQRAEKYYEYDTSDASIRSYITFQYIELGANAPQEDFTTVLPAREGAIIDMDEYTDWLSTKFEVVLAYLSKIVSGFDQPGGEFAQQRGTIVRKVLSCGKSTVPMTRFAASEPCLSRWTESSKAPSLAMVSSESTAPMRFASSVSAAIPSELAQSRDLGLGALAE